MILLAKIDFKMKIDKTIYFILLYAIIHLVSIIVNAFSEDADLERILAALNTCFIWIIAGLYFCYYKNNKIEIDRIKKYLTINMYILISLSIITIILSKLNLDSLSLFSRTLYADEWLSNGKKLRFSGFMEYSNLVIFFYLLVYPLAFSYIKEKHNKIYALIFAVMSAIPCLITNSRMGIVLVAIITAYSIYNILLSNNKKGKIICIITIFLAAIFIIIADYKNIVEKVDGFINSRPASTETRQNLYDLSIDKTINESIFIGNGIKYMYHEVPLGSHSTIIGFFYKTGIVGTMFALIGFFILYKELYKNFRNSKDCFFYIVCTLCLILYTFTEDLDGANWNLVLFFSLMGVICNNVSGKEENKIDENISIKK